MYKVFFNEKMIEIAPKGNITLNKSNVNFELNCTRKNLENWFFQFIKSDEKYKIVNSDKLIKRLSYTFQYPSPMDYLKELATEKTTCLVIAGNDQLHFALPDSCVTFGGRSLLAGSVGPGSERMGQRLPTSRPRRSLSRRRPAGHGLHGRAATRRCPQNDTGDRGWLHRPGDGYRLCPLGKPGERGRFVGLADFGASAPYKQLYEHFGITKDAVVAAAREVLS